MLLHGIFPPITTPFYPDGNVYFKKLQANVERYSKTPAAGIVVLGSTGEAIMLSDQERRDVLKVAREATTPSKVLVAGTGVESAIETLTIEGYSVLHQMMRVRWPAWRELSAAEKSEIVNEASTALAKMEQSASGQSGLYSLLGHKGDLMLVHFRQSFDELNQVELQLAQLRLSDYLEPATSYLSIIELGLYESTIKAYRDLSDRGVEQ